MATDELLYNLDGIEQARVTVDGDSIHYFTTGDRGPVIVLLHGGIIDAAHISWAPQLGTRIDEARLVVPNLPGYGQSPLPEHPLTLSYHVETIAGFLNALDLENVLVAGLSLGGGVAVGLGLEHPERLREVVAFDAMGLGRELPSGKLTWLLSKLRVTNTLSVQFMRHSRWYVHLGLQALVDKEFAIPQQLVNLVQTEARRSSAGAAFRSLRQNEVAWSGYRTDYSSRLKEMSVPVQFVHGENDEVFPVSWSEQAAERAPDGSICVLEDCGHLPTWEQQSAVTDLLSSKL